ncbi:peptidylprolyl isomerase [Candidatus Woesearchaeota archaeon]|nr:peptidylprolyl isomerase [Candidatus Woesearchaeota archaeon]
MPVKKGDKVSVEYTGKLDDGKVFDSTEKSGKPLEFEAGGGFVIKGFDEAVIGMKVGEEKDIKITPDKGYGEVRSELRQKVPKAQLPTDKKIQVGMFLLATLPNSQQFPVKVIEIGDNEVTLDLNHPLAGRSLNFKLKVVKIEAGTASEKKKDKKE